jgi:probable rRNA maturation factor
MIGQVDVQFASDDEEIPTADEIRSWVMRALAVAERVMPADISVRVVGLEESQRLNHDYRDRDGPTNVLSFPAGEIAGWPDDEAVPLGDIVVCAPVVRREAREQGKRLEDHWAHMLVHGTLHLLGFDHLADAEAREMEALETRILTEGGLDDPYGAPGHRTDRIQPL